MKEVTFKLNDVAIGVEDITGKSLGYLKCIRLSTEADRLKIMTALDSNYFTEDELFGYKCIVTNVLDKTIAIFGQMPFDDAVKIANNIKDNKEYERVPFELRYDGTLYVLMDSTDYLGIVDSKIRKTKQYIVTLPYGYELEGIIAKRIDDREIEKKTYIDDDYWDVEIITSDSEYEAWVYNEYYGIKRLMLKWKKSSYSYDEFLSTVENNVTTYIAKYKEEFKEYSEDFFSIL